MPSIFLPLSKSFFDSGFVRMSVAWSLLATCFSSMLISFTCSRIKSNRTSICLLHSWLTGFFASSNTDLLSTWIIVASSCFDSILLSNLLSHIAWHTHKMLPHTLLHMSKELLWVASLTAKWMQCFPWRTHILKCSFDHQCYHTNRCQSSQSTCILLLSNKTFQVTQFLGSIEGLFLMPSNVYILVLL